MAPHPSDTTVSASSLAALAGLAAFATAWAVFLWGELVRARAGARPFCPLGAEVDCSALWDAAFASAVHRVTGLPIAGWGVVWGVGAFLLPLLALTRVAEGKRAAALLSAVRIMAATGLVTVFVMGAVSAAEGKLCVGCAVTYVIVTAYAGVALFSWRQLGLPETRRASLLAAGLTVMAFALLLFPGTRTPRAAGESARVATVLGVGPSTGAPADVAVRSFVDSLNPELKQELSDSLLAYRQGRETPLPPPRRLIGPRDAPVRITEFTDVLCSHCAELQQTLASLRAQLPAGSFSIEPREFPLDGNCNPVLPRRGPESVRCLAARARLCLEDSPRFLEFAGMLYREQKTLTTDRVYELAARFVDRSRLQACVTGAETRERLEDDVRLAARYEPEGTPLVLVNGRKATPFAPFLYAIVLARGDGSHTAFAGLPVARAETASR
jgi:protein-disulfide isomerase